MITILQSCTHNSSSMMQCDYPDLSKQERNKTQFYIGFEMDGVKDYEIINQITVEKDPEFYYFSEPENVRNFYSYQSTLRILVRFLSFVSTPFCCTLYTCYANLNIPY